MPGSKRMLPGSCRTPQLAWLVAALCGFLPLAVAAGWCSSSAPCKLACSSTCTTNSLAAWGRRSKAVTAASAWEHASMRDVIVKATTVAQKQVTAATRTLRAGQHPVATHPSGAWESTSVRGWTPGFFAGVLWQLHALTGKPEFARLAQKWQAGLADKQTDWSFQHDLGFIYMPSFVHSYEVTKSPADLRQALAAAEALAWAYNPATRSLRTWEGWDPPHATKGYRQVVAIDFMMNIPLLLWGAKHLSRHPGVTLDLSRTNAARWESMAIEHARQVARNHVRRDGTTYHVVEYNPETAAINKRYTYQGYADNSTWARGQAWALAGFAIMARETGRREFLVTAQKLADKWLQLVTQRGEFVPVWDFDAPYRPSLNGPRDSSAAAVASLGLLTLSEALQASEGLQLGLPRGSNPSCSRRYLCAAVNTLRALTSPTYLGAGQGGAFAAVLRHGVGNLPANKQVDVGLVYGDYYYLAALQKCRSMRACGSFVE